MSSTLIALMFGAGVGAFVWNKLAQTTGNAKPMNVVVAAGVAGLVAFIFFFTLFKWVLNIG